MPLSNSSGESPLVQVPTTVAGKEPEFMSEEIQALIPTKRKTLKQQH